jgi:hypothetical protein
VRQGEAAVELEQRVKALEYEIKILKNEIQRTLLEIHEQVLVHYYPSLRTADSETPDSIVRATELLRVKPVPDPIEEPPLVRKVSLEEVRGIEEDIPPIALVSPPVKMGKLMEWGLNAAAQIGTAPTNKIIELFAKKGFIDPNTKDVLLQVSPLNRRTPPAELGIGDILRVVLKLDELLNRESDIEETLTLIKEANFG